MNIQTRFVTLLLDTSFNLQYEKRILIKLQGGEKVEGAIDKVKGEVKEVVGKVTDNKKLQAEGKWDKVKGTAKDTVGNVKEKVHEYKEHKKEK